MNYDEDEEEDVLGSLLDEGFDTIGDKMMDDDVREGRVEEVLGHSSSMGDEF